ncbi:MAG: ribonuclease III [Actinobacteria bacterium]|nr:ribonuclease III [Actinomycetota bacterium]
MPPEGGPLYETALTHRSHAFERGASAEHNERLEFLGDAILEAVVTAMIFREQPALSEGDMARLRASVVNATSLADTARALGIGDAVLLGKGEEGSGGREKASILADTFEAIVGAVFIERGFDVVKDALTPLFRRKVADSLDTGRRYDAKTELQEVVVRLTGGSPSYRVSSTGPDHDKRFTAHVWVKDELQGVGEGRSKKQAEYNAASEALVRLGSAEEPAVDGPAADKVGADEGGQDARAS